MTGRGVVARGSSRGKQMRQRLAIEAARIMVEEGVKDFLAAKRKAAEHLGATSTQHMPRNSEIEDALREYQRLFKSDTQPARLRELRQAAADAMEFFHDFQARLVGSVLRGTAGEHSDVNLHLFADTPEEVGLFLLQKGLPYELGERRFRMHGDFVRYPTYRFLAGDVVVEVVVFPPEGIRQAPAGEIDGHPMQRASLAAVKELLADDRGETIVAP